MAVVFEKPFLNENLSKPLYNMRRFLFWLFKNDLLMLILIFLVKRKTAIYLGLAVLRLGKIVLDWYVIQKEHLLYKKLLTFG